MKLFGILVLLLPSLVFAHEPKAYVEASSFWSHSVIIDGKAVKYGFLGPFGTLEGNMTSNPVAEQYAHDARMNALGAQIAIWSGLAGAIAIWSSTRVNSPEYGLGWTALAGGLIVSSIFHRYADLAFHRAINTYNGVGGKKSSYHVTPTLAPVQDGGTVGMQLSF